MKAIWNDVLIAESDQTIEIEGNQYFPPDSVKAEYIKKTDHHTTCPWKGEASYYTLIAGGKENLNAMWTYEEPKHAALQIKNYRAFWKGVKVSP